MLFRNKILGLDIGNRNIKAVELTRVKDDYHLNNFFVIDRRTHNQDISDILESVAQTKKFKNHLVAASLDDSEAQISSFNFAELSESETRNAIQNELETKTYSSGEEFSFTYSKPNDREIIGYSSSMLAIDNLQNAINQSGMSLEFMEFNFQAIIRSLRCNSYLNEKASVIVDFGDSHTSIALVNNYVPLQINVVSIGIGNIYAQLRDLLHWSDSQIESYLANYNINVEENENIERAQKIVDDHISHLMVSIHENLVYFRANFKDASISNLFLVGAVASFQGLPDLLSQSLKLPVEIPSPFKNIQIFKNKNIQPEQIAHFAPQLHTAVGLALVEDEKNLLPPLKRASSGSIAKSLKYFGSAAVLLCLIGAGIQLFTNIQFTNLRTKQALSLSTATELSNLVTASSNNNSTGPQMSHWSPALRELASLSDPDIWLTDLEAALNDKEKTLSLRGSAKSQDAVASYLTKMEASKHFKSLQLKFTESQDAFTPKLVRFLIEGQMEGGKE